MPPVDAATGAPLRWRLLASPTRYAIDAIVLSELQPSELGRRKVLCRLRCRAAAPFLRVVPQGQRRRCPFLPGLWGRIADSGDEGADTRPGGGARVRAVVDTQPHGRRGRGLAAAAFAGRRCGWRPWRCIGPSGITPRVAGCARRRTRRSEGATLARRDAGARRCRWTCCAGHDHLGVDVIRPAGRRRRHCCAASAGITIAGGCSSPQRGRRGTRSR